MYESNPAASVRVVGSQLRITYHPDLAPPPVASASQVATVSVWGSEKQADLARVHAGIVGLGSVGSIVNEALSRVGISRVSQIDHDYMEDRNLDRTLGAVWDDVFQMLSKVEVAERVFRASHTATHVEVNAFLGSVLTAEGLERALDCDVLFSCVDRPFPRHLLNAIAYAHLIPVIDGGILAQVNEDREDQQLGHLTWRIHTIAPGRACLICLGALGHEAIELDRSGMLDDPEYIKGVGPEFSPLFARQNVFPFSLSVAAHEVLQMIGLVTGQPIVGGIGPQTYHGYPGRMEVKQLSVCEADCPYAALTALATDLSGNCVTP